MTREEQISREATRYAEKNQTAIRNMLPSINAMTAYINGAKYADEHPNLYSVTRKAVARERKHLIEKAYKWLNENVEDHTRFYEDYDVHDVVASNYAIKKEFIEAFIKAIEEQQ